MATMDQVKSLKSTIRRKITDLHEEVSADGTLEDFLNWDERESSLEKEMNAYYYSLYDLKKTDEKLDISAHIILKDEWFFKYYDIVGMVENKLSEVPDHEKCVWKPIYFEFEVLQQTNEEEINVSTEKPCCNVETKTNENRQHKTTKAELSTEEKSTEAITTGGSHTKLENKLPITCVPSPCSKEDPERSGNSVKPLLEKKSKKKSSSTFAFPLKLADGKVEKRKTRSSIDHSKVNAVTMPVHYPDPRIMDITDKPFGTTDFFQISTEHSAKMKKTKLPKWIENLLCMLLLFLLTKIREPKFLNQTLQQNENFMSTQDETMRELRSLIILNDTQKIKCKYKHVGHTNTLFNEEKECAENPEIPPIKQTWKQAEVNQTNW